MTEPFTEKELDSWRSTLDFLKIGRQLEAALRPFKSEEDEAVASNYVYRKLLLTTLTNIYNDLEKGDYGLAKDAFDQLDGLLHSEFGWKWWRGDSLPRPLDKEHLARLYWDASRVLTGAGKPKPEGNGDWKRFNSGQSGKGWSRYSFRGA